MSPHICVPGALAAPACAAAPRAEADKAVLFENVRVFDWTLAVLSPGFCASPVIPPAPAAMPSRAMGSRSRTKPWKAWAFAAILAA